MNAALRHVSIVCLALIGLLMVNANYIQAIKADDLADRPGNSRDILERYENPRGPILVDGKPVAMSEETGGRLKYQRVYEPGELYAHATGYYSLYTSTGIEHEMNGLLAGTDGRLLVRRMLDLFTGEKREGASAELTLDPQAQQAAYEGLQQTGHNGAVVALNPQTGAIKAAASLPSYDPNKLASHDGEKVKEAYEQLSQNPNKPLVNRALTGTYPPGSTFKVVTSAAALSSGNYEPSTEIPAPDRLKLPQSTHYLYNHAHTSCAGDKTNTLEQALKISCNTAFANLGMQLGAETMREQAQKFGFGHQFQVPMESAKSQFPKSPSDAQLALSSIGQYEVQVTPLQMAMVAAGVANDGTVMKPYMVEEVKAPDLSVIEKATPDEYGRAMSSQAANELTGMMKTVVSEGTGTSAQIPGVQVAGKTGTAQHGEGVPEHAWFISFAPADNPQVAVAVVVENGGSGGKVAAPIAKAVMKAVLEK